MMVARVENNTVVEIIPDYALPVEQWYGAAFAEKCMEVSDNVQLGWVLENGQWQEPVRTEDAFTNEQLREQAYNTEAIIAWQGKDITVTAAAALWTYYTSEGDAATANALTEEIARAKTAIRERFPEVSHSDTPGEG